MINYNMYDIIKRPVITEKSNFFSEPVSVEQNRKYTFVVANYSTKHTVRKAVESVFGVKVTKVNMLLVKGKTKRFKGVLGYRSGYKKAIVTVGDGQNIDFVGGVK